MKLVFGDIVFFMQLVFVAINLHVDLTSAEFGVNYGTHANNLPSPKDVIGLYRQENIKLLRLFDPDPYIFEALRGSGIKVALGVHNDDVKRIATDPNAAIKWVKTNVANYAKDVNFGWITVGNEMVPGPDSEHIPRAMNNILSALNAASLTGIKVSTVVNTGVLGYSNLPSATDFTNEAKSLMNNIIKWLRGTNNPIFLNVYPYYVYASDPNNIPIDYAMFDAQNPVIDGTYEYSSLFEARVDSFYVALEKNGWPEAKVVVSETGWPTAGQEPYTSIRNAFTYNQRLILKMKQVGTPRRPSNLLDIFIFVMFNENLKPAGLGQNWGIHYPNMTLVYPLKF